jgi:hypothetical protein
MWNINQVQIFYAYNKWRTRTRQHLKFFNQNNERKQVKFIPLLLDESKLAHTLFEQKPTKKPQIFGPKTLRFSSQNLKFVKKIHKSGIYARFHPKWTPKV